MNTGGGGEGSKGKYDIGGPPGKFSKKLANKNAIK
jgi:hypothetical protein